MKNIIEIQDVWKIYQMGKVEVPALRGINLDIKEKEFLVVMGASGSGKSTSLNIIGCLDIPSKGKVFLDGQDITKLSEDELARIRGKKIGFIFQTFNLIPSLNALENVSLPMIFQGGSAEERRKRAVELLKMVGLGERIFHKPNELSGGERQRVAIARALVNNPEVILADEPTGNLDSKSGKDIMEFLTKLHKEQNKTIVMITHDPNIAKFGKRVVRLQDGRIIS